MSSPADRPSRAARISRALGHAVSRARTLVLGAWARQVRSTDPRAEVSDGTASSEPEDLRGFCAAPWVESVLYHDGILRTCCYSTPVLGNWQRDGLSEVWRGQPYQTMRGKIAAGEYPDESCRTCHANQTSRSLALELSDIYHRHRRQVEASLGHPVEAIDALEPQLRLRRARDDTEDVLAGYSEALRDLERRFTPSGELAEALHKLSAVGAIVKAYLDGDPAPKVVAPYRQVQLFNRCNARCLHCLGLYTGSIVDGPALDPRYVDEALSDGESMLSFFMNGSEFLLYPDWRRVAKLLKEQGVRLQISTNGILLTRDNVRYLIDNEMLQTLNVSMEGAVESTVERLHPRVGFSRLLDNVRFMLRYAGEKDVDYLCVFSLVAMKSNFRELGELVRLVDSLRAGYRVPRVQVNLTPLAIVDLEGYDRFLAAEHHSLIDRAELLESIESARQEAATRGIALTAFGHEIEAWVQRGRPIPQIDLA